MAQQIYILVRHTAASESNKPGWEKAVELRGLDATPKQLEKMKEAGVLIFGTYKEAQAREEAENYPEGCEGFYPKATGTFKKVRGIGTKEEVYFPSVKA